MDRVSDSNTLEAMTPTLDGYIDEISPLFVRGWAFHAGHPVAHVEVFVDGVLIGAVPASLHRADLQAAGFGQGNHAFYFEIPEAYRGSQRNIVCRIAGTGFEVTRSALCNVARSGLSGCIDGIFRNHTLRGWAFHPDVHPACVEIFADGVLIGSVLASQYRADLKAEGDGSGKHAFSFKIPEAYRGSQHKMTCRIAGTDFELLQPMDEYYQQWRQRREKKLLGRIASDVLNGKGIEFGPCCFPIIKPDVPGIRYIDHASTEELRDKYRDDPIMHADDIVNVHYVWQGESLTSLIGDFAPVDYVIASHVLEHVPNLVGWLQNVYSILKSGGLLVLALPDKRFCFDYFRQLSGPEHLVEAYLEAYCRPSPRMVFDHYAHSVEWKDKIAWCTWEPFPPESELVKMHTPQKAMHKTRLAKEEGAYIDVHCWVFTPRSFLENMKFLMDFNLLPYKIVDFFDTDYNEFIVCLEAMPTHPTAKEIAAQKNSVAQAMTQLTVNPQHGSTIPCHGDTLV
jgi:SAM-dependent methyltransferase